MIMNTIKTICFWGGFTNHHFELAKAIDRIGYKVIVIKSHSEQERSERVPEDVCESIKLFEIDSYNESIQLIKANNIRETLHINTALKNNNSMLHDILKYLCKNKYYVFSLPQESFQLKGVKGFFNFLKWFYYLHFTYRRNIIGFGLTGNNAFSCFRKLLVKEKKCFHFIYATRTAPSLPFIKNKKIRFIFVGAIDKRKNIIPFVKYMLGFKNQAYEMSIYGSWSLDNELKEVIKNTPNIKFHGLKSYSEVRKSMLKADYLVLPSLYDGWGAVANEGLQSGCKLILSEQCGSSIFPSKHSELGYVFDAYNLSSLRPIMHDVFENGPLSVTERVFIKSWADNHISPFVLANYLDKIIKHFFDKSQKPNCPWL